MELEQLRIFVAVAEAGSFSKGAKQLYISHSTTSRAVAALEDELGVQLVQRDNRITGLTPAGQLLLAEAKDILDSVDGLRAKIQALGPDAER